MQIKQTLISVVALLAVSSKACFRARISFNDAFLKGNFVDNGVEVCTVKKGANAWDTAEDKGSNHQSIGLVCPEQGGRSTWARIWRSTDGNKERYWLMYHRLGDLMVSGMDHSGGGSNAGWSGGGFNGFGGEANHEIWADIWGC